MTEEYINPILTGRELTSDEQYILYGKPASNDMTYFKADSFQMLVDLMEAVYNGETVYLPLAPKNNCMYLFYDIPVGTKHYFYNLSSYSTEPFRNTIGETSTEEIKYRLNNFLLPKIIKGLSSIDTNNKCPEVKHNPKNYYATVGVAYNLLAEFFSGGLFVNTEGSRVISITSGLAKSKMQELLFSTNKLVETFKSNSVSLSEDARKEQIGWYTYCLPTDVQKRVALQKMSEIGSPFLSSTMFNWSKNIYFVVSDKYLRLNGFVLNNEIPQVALSWSQHSVDLTTNTYIASKFVNTISSHVQSFICSSASDGFNLLSNLFLHGQIGGVDIGYYYPKNNIMSFNKESFEIIYKPYLNAVQYSEHINIDTFLGELRDAYLVSAEKNTEAYLKREFKLNLEPLSTEADFNSSRYEVVKSSDHKMMFVTKTSLAKEALKQAKISRKITETCSPVVSFIVNLFAACDLEFPGTNRSAALCTYSRAYTGCLNTAWSTIAPEVKAVYDNFIGAFRQELATKTTSICSPLVDELYKNFTSPTILGNFNNYLSVSNITKTIRYGMNTLHSHTTVEDQKPSVCFYLFTLMVNEFNYTVFSPSSNMLNYLSLGSKMYKNIEHAGVPKSLGLNTSNNRFTGHMFYHYYTNNFISISETIDKQIESGKSSGYAYVGEHQVPISTCFNWSLEASDCYGLLKKCKTFTDYYNWYKNLYATVQNRIATVIMPEDEIGATTLTNLAYAYLTVLEGLSTAETKYLPVPKVKGRKKKLTTTTTDDSSEESEEPTTEEASVTSTSV
ncbi:MAG: hypothetical protein JHC33_02120 [Ignisphaera sp.]|nr:hypothetical protein [Ignisphaera sp.]